MIAQFHSNAKRWTIVAAACMLALAALALTDAVRGDDASSPAKSTFTQPAATTQSADDQTTHRVRAQSAAEMAMLAQFERKLPEVRFDGVPFTDVVDFLRDVTGANIEVGWRALEGAGIERNAPISMRVRDIRFEHALRQLCRQVGGGDVDVGFTVDGGVIVISTIEDLAKSACTRAYDVRDLLEPTNPNLNAATTRPAREQLVQIVMENVAPDSWRDVGGSLGVIKEYDGRLVITTIDMYHFEIGRMLEELRRQRQ